MVNGASLPLYEDLDEAKDGSQQTTETDEQGFESFNIMIKHLPSSRSSRKRAALALAFVTGLLFFLLAKPLHLPSSSTVDKAGAFEPYSITGFENNGVPGETTCEHLRRNHTVAVQRGPYLEDDLPTLAKSLGSHPMVNYTGLDTSQPFEKLVEQSWGRLSGSSVWLPDHKVFLVVTRVMQYRLGPGRPQISFLRGQLFDSDWEHLENYTITWQDKSLTFPLVFDIPAQYDPAKIVFGPEDPRVVLEEGVDNAEPVVVFNMFTLNETGGWYRPMWIFRPFSNHSTKLSIEGVKPQHKEKNWAPFFHGDHDLTTASHDRQPSEHLHFVYNFQPLRILKCDLTTGLCDFVYEQKKYDGFSAPHSKHGSMRGGSNMMPIPIKNAAGVRVYAGFPRTHGDPGWGCSRASYRPELVVMTSVGSQFQLAYASGALDMGAAVLEPEARARPCDKGRIMMANSIARWDREQDVLTATFSVNDDSVQVGRIRGLAGMVQQQLPALQELMKHDTSQGGEALWNLRWSSVGGEVLACSLEAAGNFSLGMAATQKATAAHLDEA